MKQIPDRKKTNPSIQGCLFGCLFKLITLTFISLSGFFCIVLFVRVKTDPSKSIPTHAKEQFLDLKQGINDSIWLSQQGGTITYGDGIEGVINARGEQIPLEDIPASYRKDIVEKATPPKLPIIEGQPAICQTSNAANSKVEIGQNAKLKATLIHEDSISAVAISSDNRYLASGSPNRKVYIWDLNTNQLIKTWEAHGKTVTELRFTPDKRTLISSGSDGKIKFWNWQTGELLQTLTHSKGVTEIILTKDGKRLFSGGLAFEYATERENSTESKQVKLWDVTTGKLIKTWSAEGPVSHLVLSEDEQMLVSWSGHTLELRQIDNWDLLGTIQLDIYQSISGAAFSPDGPTLGASQF